MAKTRILIADDEEKIRKVLTCLLEDEDYSVKAVEDGNRAIIAAGTFKPDIVLMDQNMPGKNGIEALLELKEKQPNLTVIIITAFGEVSHAVDAIKKGAYDYLEKPFDNDKLLMLIKRAVEHKRMTDELEQLKQLTSAGKTFQHIIGISSAMKKLIAQAQCVVDTDASVLLQGESGTGKEILAQAIHQASKRRNAPIIAVNCGALPVNLIESELFGHEKGAFTDAREAKPGKFEQASEGTLFLDELGELPLDAQVKLLRVLEDKKVTRVGGLKAIPVNVRIISATNKNLEERVQKGFFRLDLFYRLNVFNIVIPPLRERPEDIPLLTDHFIGIYNKELGTSITGISNQAIELIKNYNWPGNVRELQNSLQSAMILAHEGTITTEHLPVRLRSSRINENQKPITGNGLDDNLKVMQANLEKELILEALMKTNYSRTETARLLKISRKTLFNKMKNYDL
ncbi:MAG TPA: sigma-54 dependent transcriptional regulator [Bacteroidales bacterium]|nr:sigma-54 dependent transcriptional regulator [Bacteroidales bacterium]